MANYSLNKNNFIRKKAKQVFKCIDALDCCVQTERKQIDLDLRTDMDKFENWLVERGMLDVSDYIMNLPVSEVHYNVLHKYLKKFHGHFRYTLKTKSAVLEYLEQFETIGEFIASANEDLKVTENPNFSIISQKMYASKIEEPEEG